MVASLQYGTRCPCGYCHISDVENHQQEDHMESFFLAETVRINSWHNFENTSPKLFQTKKQKNIISSVVFY